MAAPYLEKVEEAFRAGARDFHEVAELLGTTFEDVCLTFNNGLRKGYWTVQLPPEPLASNQPRLSGGESLTLEKLKDVYDQSRPIFEMPTLPKWPSYSFDFQWKPSPLSFIVPASWEGYCKVCGSCSRPRRRDVKRFHHAPTPCASHWHTET